MNTVLKAFSVVSAIGLVATTVVHLTAYFANPPILDEIAKGLFAGVFVVFAPAVFVSQKLTKEFRQKDWFRAVFRGCPHG
ncbi:MAG: hypothetical protein M5R36_24540 [Deltaproteobacteria bacterium]|nr:hypothetical protein [Deltaproteobacteria bacterium]